MNLRSGGSRPRSRSSTRSGTWNLISILVLAVLDLGTVSAPGQDYWGEQMGGLSVGAVDPSVKRWRGALGALPAPLPACRRCW
eukprot:3681075-Alexandrium_andersonii.AAC.1